MLREEKNEASGAESDVATRVRYGQREEELALEMRQPESGRTTGPFTEGTPYPGDLNAFDRKEGWASHERD